jgi:hypothetical protein
MPESSIVLVGGPHDGSTHALQKSGEAEGEVLHRDDWPLIIEFRNSVGDMPSVQAVAQAGVASAGRLVARYRLTERVTPEGHQVYEHVPD